MGDQLVPVEMRSIDDGPFHGQIRASVIGSVPITETASSAVRSEAAADVVRRNGRDDIVFAQIRLSGRSAFQQGDSEAVIGPGDLLVLDPRPTVVEAETGRSLTLELPRARLEAVLGPSRHFSTLPVAADLASTTLASAYIRELIAVSGQLTSVSAVRMAAIAIDLVIASLAERMAGEVPRSMQGNATVQRAKAYVETNLGDPSLDPPRLAAAMGLSLRRLQELFHERGRHISDYIWDRRLAVAAKRLADPACAHLPIGMIAYGCGFVSQAHFARRFRDRHGMTSTQYRMASAVD